MTSTTLHNPTTITTTEPTSPLLALPAELRLQIYTYLLQPPEVPSLRRLSTRGLCSDYVLPALYLTPSILATCRQIHSECLPLLYAENTFAAHPSLLTSMPFLVTKSRPVLHGPGKEMIRRWTLAVRLDTDPQYSRSHVENAFNGAEELELDVSQSMFGNQDYSVLRLFEGVRGVGKACVKGSVGDGRYAAWLQETMMKGVGEKIEEFRWEDGEEEGRGGVREWEPWMGNR